LLNFVNKQAAIAAGILPQARWRRAPSKKRIGCNSAEDIALAVHLSEAEVHQLVTEYSKKKANNLFFASVSAELI